MGGHVLVGRYNEDVNLSINTVKVDGGPDIGCWFLAPFSHFLFPNDDKKNDDDNRNNRCPVLIGHSGLGLLPALTHCIVTTAL